MTQRPARLKIKLEWVGAGLVLFGFWRVYSLFMSNGYLSAPFVFDISDTFMDWFNTAYWAHNGHAYDVWRTVYLPLSFVITGLLGDPSCYRTAPYDARDCDTVGIAVILLTYLACVVVTAMAFWRRDRSTAICRTIAIGIGGPLLYALERGQLIMMTYIAFALLYGNLVHRQWSYAATAAFMANTKIYMVLPLMSLMIKRHWRLFELCAIASLALYLATLFLVSAGTPGEMISNLQNWFGIRLGTVWDEMLYTTTYNPLLQLDVYQYPVREFIEQRDVDGAIVFIHLYIIFSRTLALLCIGLAWLYPKAIPQTRIIFFILMQSFIVQNPGGYSIVLIVFLVLMEERSSRAMTLAIICAYLISVPGDVTLAKLTDVERQSWLSGRVVMSEYVVPWGALIRPGVIAIMLWALAFDSLRRFHHHAGLERPSFGLMGRAAVKGFRPVSTVGQSSQ